VVAISIIFTFTVTSKLTTDSENKGNTSTTPNALTDIEQEAEQWFTASLSWPISNYPPLPERYRYTEWQDIDTPRTIYQGYLEKGEPWTNYPEQIALRVFYPPPEIEGFVPDKVNIYYYNADIVAVTVVLLSPSRISERRFDFVKVDDVWKFVWVGDRFISVQ
jgi:hypothetical protein